MNSDEGIKQLGKNKFQVRVKRIEAKTGRQRNRKLTVIGTRTDARRARDELRAELKSTRLAPRRIRLSEYAASWLEQREPSLKASTIRRYSYSLSHIIPALGDIYVDAISPADVRKYITKRAKKAEGYTVLNELRCLRTMARDSVAEGYAQTYWCDRVKAPKVSRYTKKNPNLLNAEQFVEVVKRIPEQWLGLVLFIVTTGLRWGEASALHWSDVNAKTGEATITHGNHRGTLTTVKNDSSYRTVPVLPEVRELWMRHDARLVFPVTQGERKGMLHKGSPLRRVLSDACKAAGAPRVTTHGLRRTFNNLARQKTSREVLKSITGHSTDAMVEHYSFVGHAEKMTATQAVARSLGVLS
jgi:integrase